MTVLGLLGALTVRSLSLQPTTLDLYFDSEITASSAELALACKAFHQNPKRGASSLARELLADDPYLKLKLLGNGAPREIFGRPYARAWFRQERALKLVIELNEEMPKEVANALGRSIERGGFSCNGFGCSGPGGGEVLARYGGTNVVLWIPRLLQSTNQTARYEGAKAFLISYDRVKQFIPQFKPRLLKVDPTLHDTLFKNRDPNSIDITNRAYSLFDTI